MNKRAETPAEAPYDPVIMMRIELLEELVKQNDHLLRSMDQRTDARLKALELDVAVIKSNYATKADIERLSKEMMQLKVSLIMWVLSAFILTQLVPIFLSKLGLT